VGDFIGWVDIRDSPTHVIPEYFISTKTKKTAKMELSSLASTAHPMCANKTKTLADYSGMLIVISIKHGDTLWPCSLLDGNLMPSVKYESSKTYPVNATFTEDTSGEPICLCTLH
jgi:hypothetical protein